jgi:hypothetical protein
MEFNPQRSNQDETQGVEAGAHEGSCRPHEAGRQEGHGMSTWNDMPNDYEHACAEIKRQWEAIEHIGRMTAPTVRALIFEHLVGRDCRLVETAHDVADEIMRELARARGKETG